MALIPASLPSKEAPPPSGAWWYNTTFFKNFSIFQTPKEGESSTSSLVSLNARQRATTRAVQPQRTVMLCVTARRSSAKPGVRVGSSHSTWRLILARSCPHTPSPHPGGCMKGIPGRLFPARSLGCRAVKTPTHLFVDAVTRYTESTFSINT